MYVLDEGPYHNPNIAVSTCVSMLSCIVNSNSCIHSSRSFPNALYRVSRVSKVSRVRKVGRISRVSRLSRVSKVGRVGRVSRVSKVGRVSRVSRNSKEEEVGYDGGK